MGQFVPELVERYLARFVLARAAVPRRAVARQLAPRAGVHDAEVRLAGLPGRRRLEESLALLDDFFLGWDLCSGRAVSTACVSARRLDPPEDFSGVIVRSGVGLEVIVVGR